MKIQIPLIASYLMKCAMIVMGVYSIHVHDWLMDVCLVFRIYPLDGTECHRKKI
ncbi:MAG: hypothetical protein U9N36_09490 [Euryarchaeota archaeon]|nr:hypothetical protein [Euryarchaeota archaeon]